MPMLSQVLLQAFIVACVFCCAALPSQGQSFVISINANDDGTKSTKKVLDSIKEAAIFRYQGEAKAYKDILDLDDATWKKLSIAAKGAALKGYRKQAETIIKNLRRYQQQAGLKVDMNDLNLDDDHEQKEDGDDGEDEDDNQGVFVNRNFSFGMSMPKIGPIDAEPIWKKAIGKLSKEQLERFAEEQGKRDLVLQQKLVDGFLVSVRLKVLASEQQIEKLKPIVNRELGPALLHGAKNFTYQNRGMLRFDQQVVVPEYSKAVFTVLEPAQQREWTRSIEPEMNQLYNVWKAARRVRNLPRVQNAVRAKNVQQFQILGVPAARLIPALKLNPAKKPAGKKPKDAEIPDAVKKKVDAGKRSTGKKVDDGKVDDGKAGDDK